jgi:hypothetical protein
VQQEPVAAAPTLSRLKEAERPTADTFDRAVQMLALLQRDGRLVDFLSEDISAYPDVQLGAAVHSIHEACRKVLNQYVKLDPILNSEEDQPVTVEAGFDPSAIKLIGNKRWRVKEVNMPPLTTPLPAKNDIAGQVSKLGARAKALSATTARGWLFHAAECL